MIKTQVNENRCKHTTIIHVLTLPQCCPVSNNPQPGSTITICYSPKKFILEVYSLKKYIDSYKGGKGVIRSMEGMIQNITKDCAEAICATVEIESRLIINPDQTLNIKTIHYV